jgi:ribosome-associated heat shock protein Hsp15
MAPVRLDVWLDVACLFKTRSEAKQACVLGKVTVDGDRAKPHRVVCEGDEIVITHPFGRRQTVDVVAVADRHLPKAEARALFDDRTPKPTAADKEMRRLDRAYREEAAAAGTDRRARRVIRRRKQGNS